MPESALAKVLSGLDGTGSADCFVPTTKLENAATNPEMLSPQAMPAGTALSLLGVDYFRLKTDDGGELYLTRFGRRFWKFLLP